MGLFYKKVIKNASIGVWEINETVDELYARVSLSEKEQTIYDNLRTISRKRHWLSYRLILPYLVKPAELSAIEYDEYGKPFLNNGVRHISVSHSGKFSALIVSPNRSVGIDIEEVNPKIFNIAHKFLNNTEVTASVEKNAIQKLYVIWAAKESLYKLYGKRNLMFKDNIRIFPFVFKGYGEVRGEIFSEEFTKTYDLFYQTLEKYILVYSVDN
jgi:4'-phosphopantetheinyl transferase